MGKYTSDDNRSMQLNDNNDRYYSSRGIDQDDHDEDGPPDYKWVEVECEACQHCIQWYRTGSWMPCLFPKKVKQKLKQQG